MSAEGAPQTLHRAWTATGLGLLGAGVVAPLVLSRPGVPSARSFVHHCAHAATPRLDAAWFLGALCTAFVLYAGGRALAAGGRAVRADRALRRLRPELRRVDGDAVFVVAGVVPRAFCGGVLRPRVYLSHGAFDGLTDDELRAVVAHEQHHVRRREPLRLAVRSVVQEMLFFVPVLSSLDARLRVVEELRADQMAVRRSAGDPRPIASALLRFDAAGPGSCVLAERVDGLTGAPLPWRAPPGCVLRSAMQLTVVALLGITIVFLAQGSQLVVLQACSLSMLCVVVSANLAVGVARRTGARNLLRRSRAMPSGVGAD